MRTGIIRSPATSRAYQILPRRVGVLVFVRVGGDLFADDRAELSWTGEILMIIRGKQCPLNVGEAKIVEAAAIEHWNHECASAATGELTFQ